jgi:predicted acylesterase/phospholipase RssA
MPFRRAEPAAAAVLAGEVSPFADLGQSAETLPTREYRSMPIPRQTDSLSRRHLLGLSAATGAISLLSGCAAPDRGTPVPNAETERATVLGLANERFFPFLDIRALEQEFHLAVQREQQALGLPPGDEFVPVQLLAISGGGENGAFGAGLLCGWSEQGTRPVFEVVTGVSTGALTAPFAYLGSRYDDQLRAVYTELSPNHVLESRFITAALFNDAMADNTPLFKTISVYLTEAMLSDIAKAYDDGRILLIATTNLDEQEPVLWNIGAIAKSGHPKALDTIRRILLASAAIPGAFPPTMFDVTANGKPYQEMHVDGGAFSQVFLYPPDLLQERKDRIRKGLPVVPASAYVIRNGRLEPDWADVKRQTLSIAARAIATLISVSGQNDIQEIYNTTQDDRISFYLAYIRSDFDQKLPKPFDPAFMRSLFAYGFAQGKRGGDWVRKPPHL